MMGLFLYLSQLKENKITWYAVDSATGDLARQGDIATPGEPGVQGTSPDRKILYVAMRSTGALCSFASNRSAVSSISCTCSIPDSQIPAIWPPTARGAI